MQIMRSSASAPSSRNISGMKSWVGFLTYSYSDEPDEEFESI